MAVRSKNVSGRRSQKLRDDSSPEQISGWLKAEYDEGIGVSHEVIYQTLFVQVRGALGEELKTQLPTRRFTRKCQLASSAGQPRGMIRSSSASASVPPKPSIAPFNVTLPPLACEEDGQVQLGAQAVE